MSNSTRNLFGRNSAYLLAKTTWHHYPLKCGGGGGYGGGHGDGCGCGCGCGGDGGEDGVRVH